jgi:predicted O-linked N-acetylglucosamine transferase (SPINDLY family)
LGVIYSALKRNGDAEKCLRRALATKPDFVEAHNNLGNALSKLGRLTEAERSFRRALALNPDYVGAHVNLGVALKGLGKPGEAEQHLRTALALDPKLAEAQNNLGNLLKDLGRPGEAEQSFRQALSARPDYFEAHSNLANTLLEAGRIEEAEQCCRNALALRPDFAEAGQNLLFILNHVAGRSPTDIYAEHREFAQRLYPYVHSTPHDNVPDPGRKLRVGYISGDLRDHPVGQFMAPVLARHDRNGFEVYCYYNYPSADAETARLMRCAAHWRDVFALSDDELTELIRKDGIDILVDLSGHTGRNRLSVFARKPAPVQVTWLGYLNTTGMAAMDYRITDTHASPEGLLDAFHSERLVRLPDSQWCYEAPAICPEVSEAPCVKAGFVTFASFSSLARIGPAVIELWSRLLACVPDSRLLLVRRGLTSIRSEFLSRFSRHGVNPDQIDLRESVPFQDYLALHGAADIVLDTFPYTGGTTTCHALWMGVPVVSLVGNTATSRGGASLLNVIGLGDLVAGTPDEYVDIAAGLANDRQRLTALRAGMRDRMAASPLMDAARFTRNLESAYRSMWRSWCQSH